MNARRRDGAVPAGAVADTERAAAPQADAGGGGAQAAPVGGRLRVRTRDEPPCGNAGQGGLRVEGREQWPAPVHPAAAHGHSRDDQGVAPAARALRVQPEHAGVAPGRRERDERRWRMLHRRLRGAGQDILLYRHVS